MQSSSDKSIQQIDDKRLRWNGADYLALFPIQSFGIEGDRVVIVGKPEHGRKRVKVEPYDGVAFRERWGTRGAVFANLLADSQMGTILECLSAMSLNGVCIELPAQITQIIELEHAYAIAVTAAYGRDNVFMADRTGRILWQIDADGNPNVPGYTNIGLTKDGRLLAMKDPWVTNVVNHETGKIVERIPPGTHLDVLE